MARSKIWKYYDKLDLNSAQCILCEKIIKTCGNTSNLMKHMKTHPQIDVNDLDSIVVRGMLKRDPITPRTARKILKFASIKNKSEVKREMEEEVEDEPEDTISDVIEMDAPVESVVVHEETYANWAAAETESATDTVSGEDIIEFEPKEAQDQGDQGADLYHTLQQDEPIPALELVVSNFPTPQNTTYLDNLAYFVCRDKQPLQIIEGEGFKRLAQGLYPAFQLPSTEQLAARIAQKAHLQIAQLRQQFAHMQTLSLSCSINRAADAEEQLSSYLEVVAHYHEGLQRRSRMLAVQTLPVQHNASHIVERLERICQRFDIDKSKIMCIVSDRSQWMDIAVETMLGGQRHVPCFAQLLETIFELVMQRQELTALCEKLNPLGSGPRRAIARYELLERFVKHATVLHKWDALTSSELELAAELLAVLAPLAGAVRQLCGASIESYPCASQALPIAYTVLNELKLQENADRQQHQLAYELRLFVIRQLEERFEGMEQNTQLALASLLDPRYRNMPFQNGTLVTKYMTHLYDLYEEKGGEAVEETTTAEDTYDFWSSYRAFSREKHKPNGESEHEDEISSYFCTSTSSLQTEPLLLWKDLAQFHPFLHSLAKKYLHIPAAAMPPSRIFTAAGAVLIEQQGRLFGDDMSNMLFMADCNQSEWQL